MTKIIELVKKQDLCSLPWTHAEISVQHNNIKPCCKYRDTLGFIGYITEFDKIAGTKTTDVYPEFLQFMK